MLQGSRRQSLSLGDALGCGVPFDDGGGNAALAKLDGERETDRPTADDDNLIAIAQNLLCPSMLP